MELTGPDLERAAPPGFGQHLVHAFGIAPQRLGLRGDDQAGREVGEYSVDRGQRVMVRVLGADAVDDHRQGESDAHPICVDVGVAGAAFTVEFEQRADTDDACRRFDPVLPGGENGCECQESACRVTCHDGVGRVRALVQEPAVGAQAVRDGLVDGHLGVLSILDVHYGKPGPAGQCHHDVRVGVEAAEEEPAAVQVQDGAVGERAVSRLGSPDGLDGDAAEGDAADAQSPPRAKSLEPCQRVDATTDRGEAILDGSIPLVGNRSAHLSEKGSAGDAVARAGSATRASGRQCAGR
ncbi:hypothetical protein A5722_00720 [Mycobacterium vulneris]|nr:hypothetical protein A5722_00720 [Mycolicibacterium vulneris]OCB66678.1 hypothetical protein A5729_10620 [Mycolicibacterium vulneris]